MQSHRRLHVGSRTTVGSRRVWSHNGRVGFRPQRVCLPPPLFPVPPPPPPHARSSKSCASERVQSSSALWGRGAVVPPRLPSTVFRLSSTATVYPRPRRLAHLHHVSHPRPPPSCTPKVLRAISGTQTVAPPPPPSATTPHYSAGLTRARLLLQETPPRPPLCPQRLDRSTTRTAKGPCMRCIVAGCPRGMAVYVVTLLIQRSGAVTTNGVLIITATALATLVAGCCLELWLPEVHGSKNFDQLVHWTALPAVSGSEDVRPCRPDPPITQSISSIIQSSANPKTQLQANNVPNRQNQKSFSQCF